MKSRLEYIDIAKGILILLVMIGHVYESGPVHDFIYSFHMAGFFLISGMLFRYSSPIKRPIGEMIVHKTKTLMIPYFCFEVYGVVLSVITEGPYLNIKGYIYQILTFELTNVPLWFLVVLYLSEISFILIYRSIKQRTEYLYIIVVILIILNGFIMPKYDNVISPSTILFALMFLCIGYLIQPLIESKKNLFLCIIPLIITVILSQLNKVNMSNFRDGSPSAFFATCLLGSYSVLVISLNINVKLLDYFGKNSLIVFGTHSPINRLVKYCLGFQYFPIAIGVIYLAVLILLEIVIITGVNKFMLFALGRWYSKEN